MTSMVNQHRNFWCGVWGWLGSGGTPCSACFSDLGRYSVDHLGLLKVLEKRWWGGGLAVIG